MKVARLAFVTVVLTYLLIVFGGYVASSKSGMGCGPDWPLCNGVLVPSLHGETLVEYTHRVIGAFLTVLAVFLFIAVLRSNPGKYARSAAFWMMGLLVVQILLGAVVVIYDLPSIIIAIHLLVAMIFLAILIFFWRAPQFAIHRKYASPAENSGRQRKLIFHINVILGLLLLLIVLGAYIKHQYYGMACSWLDCRQSLLPVTPSQIWQTLHRLLAVISAIYILLLAFRAFFKSWQPGLRGRLLLAAITVLAQLFIGIFTIISNIELSWAVFHLAIGTALFAIVFETRLFLWKR